ncbi:MAG: redoxin domain-containing protein [Deltaproteobacteria bacterium]|nr:redoxin domain-containing protein [Deltaproteobacteria bacterium]
MMKALMLLFLFFGLNSYALIQVGDPMPDMCWTKADNSKICLQDARETVRVLIYGAGWCAACGNEMQDLAARVSVFDGRPVTFVSLSISGWQLETPADSQFLTQWEDTYEIPFAVAAASLSEMKQVFSELLIPSVIIIDKSGKLAFKGINPGTDVIFEQVRLLLHIK